MSKVDLKREIPTYTARSGRFDIVDVAPARYLMIDGAGDPNTSPEYADAVATLYPIAYRAKFLSKNELGRDYVVMPLEALWWAGDLTAFTTARDKTQWNWTVMILTPEWITDEHLATVRGDLAHRPPPALDALRCETLHEGAAVQTLHIGPYDAEGPVLARLHEEFLPAHGLRESGHHHEIYLGDPRRTPAEKLRTILRQPVREATGG